jgi:molybdopterin-guanine dinucleotide biosynthesis adapter protein
VKVVAFSGHSGVGKTTLMEQLLPLLKSQGLRVSVVKHAHHPLDIDQPGKDTWRHREAGAFEVVAVSPQRLVLMREYERSFEMTAHQAIAELYPGVDWVLVEGFSSTDLLKVEVWRHATAKPARYPDDPFVVAVATDSPEQLPEVTLRPVLDLNRIEGISKWLIDNADRFEYESEKYAVD